MSRERLTKLLGMLGSDFDGERANAARMIADMAKKEGKGVADYVMGSGAERIVYNDRVEVQWRDKPCAECARRAKATDEDDLRNHRPKQPRKPSTGPSELMKGLRDAQDYPEHLNGFEMEFIEDVLRKYTFDYELSDKQAKVARRIIAKIAAAEGDPLI